MLATPRGKHLHLDDWWVRRAARTFANTVNSFSGEGVSHRRRDGVEAGGDKRVERVRELAIELNGLQWQSNRAASELEPAHLARFATSVATRLEGTGLADRDPLVLTGRWAIGIALDLLQIGRS
jgi:hypothetical protein